jgi:hypothetical protein
MKRLASIENLADITALQSHLENLDETELLAQQLTQQGAIHAITFLLANGCTESLAIEVLASLRQQMETVSKVAEAKGYTRLFSSVAPNFN